MNCVARPLRYPGKMTTHKPVVMQTILDMDAREMGVKYRMYSPENSAPYCLMIAFHGGNFIDGSVEWDEAQNRKISEMHQCMVYQLDLPKTLAAFMKWCNSLALRNWLQSCASSYDNVFVLGRSSGGYLAKVFYDRHTDLIARAAYLCPVMDPFKRARCVGDKRHGTYSFFAGCRLPLEDGPVFDENETVVVPFINDVHVPILCQPASVLRIAVRSKEFTHKELCTSVATKTLKLLGFRTKRR